MLKQKEMTPPVGLQTNDRLFRNKNSLSVQEFDDYKNIDLSKFVRRDNIIEVLTKHPGSLKKV
jgi:hypothetical protein